MKSSYSVMVVSIILVGSVAAYFYWQDNQPKPAPLAVHAPLLPPLSPTQPEVHQVIEAPPTSPTLPELSDSDNFMLKALTGLVGDKSLMKFFHAERIIRNIVATVDNLTRSQAPMSVMPVKQAPGSFATASIDSGLIISPNNSARYTPYVKIAERINAKQLVGLYIRLYPLFQQVYEELGYPNKYFNDRLIQTIDNLLDAPVVKGPIRLVQPNVVYKFADPDLERRSIGQRILIRTGTRNEAIIKSKLHEIKQELILHMHASKI